MKIKKEKIADTQNNSKHREKLLVSLHNFKEKTKEIESTFPSYSNLDNVLDNLFFLEKTMTDFEERYTKMDNMLENLTGEIKILKSKLALKNRINDNES